MTGRPGVRGLDKGVDRSREPPPKSPIPFDHSGRGQLGTGDFETRDAPATVCVALEGMGSAQAGGVPFAGIAAGMNHSLVVDATGHALSCGDNTRGQLGRGQRACDPTQWVPGASTQFGRVRCGSGVTQVGAGFNLSAMVKASGLLYTFGQGNEGGLGHGQGHLYDVPRAGPVHALADHHIVAVAVGSGHMVALTATGRAFSWGNNDDWQTGRKCSEFEKRESGNVYSAFEVAPVPLPGPAQSVSAGFASSFVLGLHGPPVIPFTMECRDSEEETEEEEEEEEEGSDEGEEADNDDDDDEGSDEAGEEEGDADE